MSDEVTYGQFGRGTADAGERADASRPFELVVVNGGVSDPSSTGMLADRIRERVAELARAQGLRPSVRTIDLRGLANEIATGLTTGLKGPKLTTAVEAMAGADALVVAGPVYKAGISGLVKSFFDLQDNDLLIAKPVLLAATAGTIRHALVVDGAMRELFSYLRAMVVPTGVFASSEDWGERALGERIDRAAVELLALVEGQVERRVRDHTWGSYQHELGSAGGAELEIDLDSEMMRLATGGSAP